MVPPKDNMMMISRGQDHAQTRRSDNLLKVDEEKEARREASLEGGHSSGISEEVMDQSRLGALGEVIWVHLDRLEEVERTTED